MCIRDRRLRRLIDRFLVRIHVGLYSQRTFQSGGERLFGAFQIEVLVQIDFLCLCNRLVELRKVRAVNQGVQGVIQMCIRDRSATMSSPSRAAAACSVPPAGMC